MAKMSANHIDKYISFGEGVFSNYLLIWVSVLIVRTAPSFSHVCIDFYGGDDTVCMTAKKSEVHKTDLKYSTYHWESKIIINIYLSYNYRNII